MDVATNVPYVKQYDEQGLPVKVGTIKNDGTNRESRRKMKIRPFNNKGKNTQIVHKFSPISFLRYQQVIQTVGRKQIIHLQLK